MTPDAAHATTGGGETYVPVEAVAEQLGLPVGLLVRRLRAGLMPGRRLDVGGRETWLVPAGLVPAPPPVAPEPATPAEPGVPATAPAAPVPADAAQVEDVSPPRPRAAATAPPELPPVAVHATPQGPSVAPVPAPPPPGAPPAPPVPADPVVVHAPRPPDRSVDAQASSVGTLAELSRVGDDGDLPAALSRTDIDARELVAALLQRWEHEYAQRLEAEFRLRYEGTINELRAQVTRHDAEMQRLRAEAGTGSGAAEDRDHRAALAERDRELAAMREQLQARLAAILERDRLIHIREAELAAARHAVDELRRGAVASSEPVRRTPWWRRGGRGTR